MVLSADGTGTDSDLNTVQRAQPSQSSSTAAGAPREAAGNTKGEWSSAIEIEC